MTAGKSIKKNYILNVCYQIILLIIPVITQPYLARALGTDVVGKGSFTEANVSYFVLLASLGIATYGQREISFLRDNKHAYSTAFWECKILGFFTAAFSLVAYLIIVTLFFPDKLLYYILSINLLYVAVDITWFFQGLEEFGKIVLRNIVIRILNVIYIFAFIKKPSDLALYLFGLGFFTFIGNMSLWVSVGKYIEKPRFRKLKPFSRLSGAWALFVPTVAIQVYTVLDKTMIGIITNDDYENGYYDQAIKLARVVLAVVTALGTVMIPRIGYHYSRNESDVVKNYMYRSYRFVWFIGVPMCFGLIAVSANFVPWFLGPGYEGVIPLLRILSFLILAVGINNATGMQYLIPTKRQNLFTRSVIIGAVVNFFLNAVLIYLFDASGASVASVVAEATIAGVQLYYVRKELSVKSIFASCKNYIIAGAVMLLVLHPVAVRLKSSSINTVILVVIGGCAYVGVLLLLRDSFFIQNTKNVLSTLQRKLIKRKNA